MIARAIALICTAALVSSAFGQAEPPGGGEYPYVGQVKGTNVNVRSMPLINFEYRCSQLSSPAEVTAVGKQDQWLKILPPKGCFSAITKRYVHLDEGGQTGTVTGDNVLVRAGGDMRPFDFVTVQTRLNKGDAVRILGEAGDYYKIESPSGVYFWIDGRYVVRAGPAPVTPTPPPPPKPAPPVPTPTPTTTVATRPVTTVVSPRTAEELAADVAAYQQARQALQEEYQKPLAQRDLTAVLARFQAIEVADNSYLKPHIDAHVQFLQGALKQMEQLKAIEAIAAQSQTRGKQVELELAKLDVESTGGAMLKAFAAQGILVRSEIFRGQAGAVERFVLRDPDGKINCYVQCTSGAVDLSRNVGDLVGVLGSKRYDKDLEVDLVEATGLVVLKQGVALPPPPGPIVGPMPVPKPKPTPPPPATRPVEEPKIIAPEPKPAPTPVKEPTTKPAPEPKPAPTPVEEPTIIAPEPKPAPTPVETPATQPTPEPVPDAPTPVRPIMIPPLEPEPQPETPEQQPEVTTQPVEKLPPSGLPVVEPTTQPDNPINEEEYK